MTTPRGKAPLTKSRSGEQVAAPQSVGSPRFPAKEPAPGTYVRQ